MVRIHDCGGEGGGAGDSVRAVGARAIRVCHNRNRGGYIPLLAAVRGTHVGVGRKPRPAGWGCTPREERRMQRVRRY